MRENLPRKDWLIVLHSRFRDGVCDARGRRRGILKRARELDVVEQYGLCVGRNTGGARASLGAERS